MARLRIHPSGRFGCRLRQAELLDKRREARGFGLGDACGFRRRVPFRERLDRGANGDLVALGHGPPVTLEAGIALAAAGARPAAGGVAAGRPEMDKGVEPAVKRFLLRVVLLLPALLFLAHFKRHSALLVSPLFPSS